MLVHTQREEKLVISLINCLHDWRIHGLLARTKLVRGRKRERLTVDQTSRDGENVESDTTLPTLTLSILSLTFANRQAWINVIALLFF